MNPKSLLKLAFLAGAALLAVIAFVHVLPWILAILAVAGLVKLWHWLTQPPRYRPPPRWPWRDD